MRRFNPIPTGVCSAVFVAAGILSSYAIMESLSTAELVNQSATIIIGSVVSKQSAWSVDGKKIVTHYQVEVTEKVAGQDAGKIVEIEHDGGVVGETGLEVSDVATMETNTVVLLFLNPARKVSDVSRSLSGPRGSLYEVAGDAQGRYFITRGGLAWRGGFTVSGTPAKADTQLPLSELRSKIRESWAKKNNHSDK